MWSRFKGKVQEKKFNGIWNAPEEFRTRALCEANKDVDECILGTDNCHAHASCTNTDGSFTCECNDGFQGNGAQCSDVNECVLGTDNCHAHALCINTDGGFACKCNDGYHGNGVQCSDVDECILGTDNCHAYASCTNTGGSFTCNCNDGYQGNGVQCSDVNECVLGTDNCHAHASCINTGGSFNCKCNDGFKGNGVQCSAIPCYGKPVDFRAREPDGSESMGYFAYELTDKHLNWHEAKAACKSKGGWLAWIGIRYQPGW